MNACVMCESMHAGSASVRLHESYSTVLTINKPFCMGHCWVGSVVVYRFSHGPEYCSSLRDTCCQDVSESCGDIVPSTSLTRLSYNMQEHMHTTSIPTRRLCEPDAMKLKSHSVLA